MVAFPLNEILLTNEKEKNYCISVIWDYVTNHFKIWWLKTTLMYCFCRLREWHFCLGWLLHLYSVAWMEPREPHSPPGGLMLAVGWTPASMWPFIQMVFPSSGASLSKCGLSLQQDSLNFLIWLLEKEIATYFSILACRIPWTEERVRQEYMGSWRVRHDSTLMVTRFFQDIK